MIELRGLTKRYRRISAVEGVSLDVAAGLVLALLGPDGAGKTMTIKMMTGLVIPTAGTARMGGYDVENKGSRAVRLVGAVLKGSSNVYWSLSTSQTLLYFGRLRGSAVKRPDRSRTRSRWRSRRRADCWSRCCAITRQHGDRPGQHAVVGMTMPARNHAMACRAAV
jgi:ABC-2 type transport system ATP-binding protein